MKNSFLSLFTSGLLANLPPANQMDAGDAKITQFYYATDTNAFLIYNPTTAAWELQYQLKPVTFANLPTVGKIVGSEAFVSDATTPTKGGVIAGAGAVLTGAVWDGAAWRGV